VSNQPPVRAGGNAFTGNPWLRALTDEAGLRWAGAPAHALGAFACSEGAMALAREANRRLPELRTHDRHGRRIDEVEYGHAYHALMARALGSGLHSLAWTAPSRAFTGRALLFYLWNGLEHGTACPVTMTFAGIPVLRVAPEIAREWEPRILAQAYDPRPVPAFEKPGATLGMAMTEKQGGSDLRAVQTAARPTADGAFLLTGHKWFCSAPMSDAFLTLARLPQGVTCFFLPRSLPDGTRNTFLIQRLKDKCGNRSNASAEVEFRDTQAWIVGEPGRGIATLIEMAHHTRFDIVVATAAMMRMALDEALHHARHREAFGKRLVEHALMVNALADLALEAEAATRLAFRLARAFDASGDDERERAVQRVLTPIAKYWHCKRLTPVVAEAMEILGGNGYVEDGPMARLFREAPLNGIWEGSGNVIVLDVLRSIAAAPQGLEALLDEMRSAGDARLARHADGIARDLAQGADAGPAARSIAERIALGAQAAVMAREADPAAADAFIASRLGENRGLHFGTLDGNLPLRRIVDAAG
jgi:putative acyl-CoA dehydrogenase